MPPRIVIVDDDPTFLATVRVLLEADGFDVVGEALNGVEGAATAEELDPDLVLVDVNLPDIDGFEVVKRLAERGRVPPVVLTSSRAESDFGELVGRSGAYGFLTKAEISGDALAKILDGSRSSR